MRLKDDPDLVLLDGVCNHCRRYDQLITSRVVSGDRGRHEAQQIAAAMRANRKGPYDCVIGLSGGVDSTYVALAMKGLGLNPLAVHVDNGWNSNVAVENIYRTLKKLNIDLVTEVLDLREFYDLQRAFLYASTPDGDIPADHAIQAVLWKTARRFKIKFIVSGMNFRTEAIWVPTWSYGHSDWRYIRSVHNRHGSVPLSTYPHYGLTELMYVNAVERVQIASILNYLDYDKSAAVKRIEADLAWQDYGGKHFESIYTRFYQGYVLPTKFGIDKRRGHYSDLINSGQLTRIEALKSLSEAGYPDDLRRRDESIFRKKLQLSEDELASIMALPIRSFQDYPNVYGAVQALRRLANFARRRGLYPK